MPIITCDTNGCDHARELNLVSFSTRSGPWRPSDQIRGVFICSQCSNSTPFGLTEEAITFKPGGDIVPPLNPSVPGGVQERYREAQLCWFGSAPRGAAVMARATVEDALKLQGITEGTL